MIRIVLLVVFGLQTAAFAQRPRARELGIIVGSHPPGAQNAITDVAGVRVGHTTLHQGKQIHTGVTAILPHGGNWFQDKVPAAIVVQNGFGKLIGFTQVAELGQLETPILLTNTLAVWDAAVALTDHVLRLPGNESVQSINPVIGETNDGDLNDIRKRVLTRQHFIAAIKTARTGKVEEGAVGAGSGTSALGFKGGIGSASRKVATVGATVGVLVQSNYGGVLSIQGRPLAPGPPTSDRGGSCMIVIATDAPLDARQLQRLARRSFAGMARTGASFSHGSGDYAIAFTVAPELRMAHSDDKPVSQRPHYNESQLTPLLTAVADATEEAIYNSLLQATTTRGYAATAEAIPISAVRRLLGK